MKDIDLTKGSKELYIDGSEELLGAIKVDGESIKKAIIKEEEEEEEEE